MIESREEGPLPEAVLFGSSSALEDLRQTTNQVSATTIPLMITGETGTGKEVLARYIHSISPWREGPFLKINCPIVRGWPGYDDPLSLAIISLITSSVGEPAMGYGTLLLNEVALLESSLQLRLLEKLRDGPLLGMALPHGGHLGCRLICTTSRRMEEEIEAGTFLRKLYQMLDVITLELPPLRNRAGDIPRLVDYFLGDYNRKFQASVPLPSRAVLNRLNEYRWPGNIRELENLMIRYVIKGTEEAFSGELGARPPRPSPAVMSAKEPLPLKMAARQVVQEYERKIIRKVLEEHHWNRRETARALKISYRALLYKIKDAGVPPKRNVSRGWAGGIQASVADTHGSPKADSPSS